MTRSITNDARGYQETLAFTGRLSTLRNGVARGFAGLFFAILAPLGAAQEAEWSRYENDFFIAYSNASTYQARKILEDLEYFRGAALRIPGIELPDDALKTLVIIPATAAEFSALAENSNSVGFAQPLEGRTAIVFPATGRTHTSKYILHHEYAHALAHVNSIEYPQWYSEGFAEIASSVVVHKRRKSFFVGTHEGRFGAATDPKIDWNELISDEFDAHSFADPEISASAYSQYWLLVHFLTLSGSEDYLLKLEKYFALVEDGIESNTAFVQAIGMTPNDLWETKLKDYLNQVPEYRHSFGRNSLDQSFEQRPARHIEYKPILQFFRDRAAVSRGIHQTDNPLAMINGKWDQLSFTNQCNDVLDVRFEQAADRLVIDNFYTSKSKQKVPAIFRVRHGYGTSIRLENVTDTQYAEIDITPNYQLTVRGEDVICLDSIPSEFLCERVLQRCDRAPDSMQVSTSR